MKKRIIRTLVTMGLAVSVIMPGAQVFAQDNTTAEFTYTGSNNSDYKGQSTVVIEGKANSGNTEELQCVTVDMRKLAQFKNAKVLKFAKGVKYVAFKTKPDTGDKLDDKITGQDYLKSADKTGIEKIEFSSDFVKPYSHDWANCIEEKLNQCFPKLKKVSISKNNKYYKVSNDVIFSKDGKKLVMYLANRPGKSYKIPAKCRKIGYYAFENVHNLKSVTISKNVKSKNVSFANAEKLEKISVSKKNKVLASKNGVLYNKKMTTLLEYPMGKKNTSFRIPKTVQTMDYVPDNIFMKKLYVPKKFTSVYYMKNWKSLTEIKLEKGNKKLAVKGGVIYNKKHPEWKYDFGKNK